MTATGAEALALGGYLFSIHIAVGRLGRLGWGLGGTRFLSL